MSKGRLELEAHTPGKRGMVKLYRAFEPLFSIDEHPIAPLIAREVSVFVSESHADFQRIRGYLGDILGRKRARRLHFLKASFSSGELNAVYNVSFSA